MKIAVISVLALMTAAGGASGAITTYSGPMTQASERIVLSRSGAVSRQPVGIGDRGPAFVDVYDNINTTPLASVGLVNAFLGDNVITTGVGTIREFEFAPRNAGTAVWTTADISFVFLEFDGVSNYNLIDLLTFDNVTLNLPGGFFTTLVLTDPGITFSNPDLIVAVRFTDVQGIGANQAHQILANPVVVGTSSNNSLVADLGMGLQFANAGTQNNVAYRIAIPAPGAFALVGLGGLVALRRRR